MWKHAWWTVLLAAGLTPTPTAHAILLNGVECNSFTVTGSTTNGALDGDDLVLEIHDCGPDGISPFDNDAGPCGNGTIDAGEQCDGSDLAGQSCASRGFAGGVLSCNGVCQFDVSGCLNEPPPTPTPPVPCPDGFLDEVTSPGFYGVRDVRIPVGETRQYCATVDAPLVPMPNDIQRIQFAWQAEADVTCGFLRVTAGQSFSPGISRTSTGNSGSLLFLRSRGRFGQCPECTLPGIYIVTATNVGPAAPSPVCELFGLLWRAS